METPPQQKMNLADSDDDLAAFLSGLRKRYHLAEDSTPLPAQSPLSRLALSTEGNIIGGSKVIIGQPEFLNTDSIGSSPASSREPQAAATDEEAAEETIPQPAATAAETTAGGRRSVAAEPAPQPKVAAAVVGGPASPAAAANAASKRQAEAAARAAERPAASPQHSPARSPEPESEPGSCASPTAFLLLQQLQQQTASQFATAAGAAGSTPTDLQTIAGGATGAVAGAGTPGTTAAMPGAWAGRLQQQLESPIPPGKSSDTSITAAPAAAQAAGAAQPAGGGDMGHDVAHSSELLQVPTAAPAGSATAAGAALYESPGRQAAATADAASSSVELDSASVKKPLYSAFMAAAGADTAAAAAAADAGGTVRPQQGGSTTPSSSTASTPRSSRGAAGSPSCSHGRMRRNVSFSMQDTAVPAAAQAQQQQQEEPAAEQQQQHHQGLLSPGGMWRKGSCSPTRGVLKHPDVQQQQQQQQQLDWQQQHVWHHNQLFQAISSPFKERSLAPNAPSGGQEDQAHRQQQQQQLENVELLLQPIEDVAQQQQPEQEQLPQHQQQQLLLLQVQTDEQQLQLQPPRSPTLQEALRTLQSVQGSLAQLQRQHSGGPTIVEVLGSSGTAAAADQATAGDPIAASPGARPQLQQQQHAASSPADNLITASVGIAAAATAAEGAAALPGGHSMSYADPLGVVAGVREWGSAGGNGMHENEPANLETATAVADETEALDAAAGAPAVAPAPAVAAVSDSAVPSVPSAATPAAATPAAAVDWVQLSSKLSMSGFGPLSLVETEAADAASASAAAAGAGTPDGNGVLPALDPLCDTLSQVLCEYQRRDGLVAALLQDRDELRREVGRSTAQAAKAERQRDDALRALDRTKAELADVRSREVPALEAKHKEAQAKLSSEVARLKHALKEAEHAAAAAKQAAATAASQEQLQQQLQETIKERERFSLECERLASEVARQKPYIRDLERAAAAARTTARQADEQAALLQRQMGQMRQQQLQEVDALAAELSKARHTAREAEQQLAALKAEAASRSDTTQELMKQLAGERAQHDEQTAHFASELQKLRQQLLDLQQAAAKAEAAAKADSSAAVYANKQLAAQEKSFNADLARLTAESKQAREANQLTAAKLQQAEAAAAEQAKTATAAAAAAKDEAYRAAMLLQELEKIKAGSKQQLQLLGEQLTAAKRALADTAQQLASSQGELRRLRAAAGLADGSSGSAAAMGVGALAAAPAAAAAAGGADVEGTSSIGAAGRAAGFRVQPPGAARVVLQMEADPSEIELSAEQEEGLIEITLAPNAAAATAAAADDAGADGEAAETPASSESGAADKENSFAGSSNALAAARAAASTGKRQAAGVTTISASAAAAPAVCDADLVAALGRAVRAEAAAAEAEGALVALRYKMLTLEAAGTRMERELEALRDRLGDKVIKEERRLARDKAAYARIRQAYASTVKRPAPAGLLGGLEANGGVAGAARRAAAGAIAAAARELRPVELVGIYEGQKEALERELAAAKAEVRVLAGQLRDAQNLLIAKDRAAAVAAAAAGLKGGAAAAAGLGDPAAAVAAQRKAAELTRELCSVRAEAASALREAAKRLAETEAQLNQLKGDNEDLQQELAARPTQQENRQLKREIDMLQRKIASLKRQAAAAVAGGTAAAGEDALALTAAAVAADEYDSGDAWPNGETAAAAAASGLRGFGGKRSVAAAVARDRAVARLGLRVVEEYPRDVLVDLVQDVCVVLELRDATLLLPNLRKMAAVLAAIPKLEAFVAQVCETCFRQGIMFVPPDVQQDMNPGTVPQVLQHWIALLQQGEQLRQLVQQLQQLLAQRCSALDAGAEAAAGVLAAVTTPIAAAGQAMQLQQLQRTGQELLGQVQQLLQVEAEAIAADDLLVAAKGLMASQPEGLLQALLHHTQQLFDIPELEALPAAMNKVYVHYSELANFFRALCSLLCLPGDAGPGTAMATIGDLLQQAAKPPSKVRQAAAELQRASGFSQASPPADTGKIQPAAAAADADGAAGLVNSGGADRALQALLAALGVGSVQQAVQLHKDMQQRLQRLDEVLPRYQRLASQLYERLRVVALEDILPALDAVMAAAS